MSAIEKALGHLLSAPGWDKHVQQLKQEARACDVMSECVEHGESVGADRAEMKAAEQQLLDALLGNSSGSPNGSDMRLVPVERLREIEWAIPVDRGDRMDGICPCCARSQEEGRHAPDCWLGNAITENPV